MEVFVWAMPYDGYEDAEEPYLLGAMSCPDHADPKSAKEMACERYDYEIRDYNTHYAWAEIDPWREGRDYGNVCIDTLIPEITDVLGTFDYEIRSGLGNLHVRKFKVLIQGHRNGYSPKTKDGGWAYEYYNIDVIENGHRTDISGWVDGELTPDDAVEYVEEAVHNGTI